MDKQRKKYSHDYLVATHRKSSSHKEELLAGRLCGCFYCEQTFSPSEITEWMAEPSGGKTAICPKCGIDSILGEELPIEDKAFLSEMNILWFG